MAQPAPLVTKFFLALLIFSGCGKNENTELHQTWVKSLDTSLQINDGRLYRSGQLFTGSVFEIFPAIGDTVEISSFKNGLENGAWKKFYPGHKLRELREFRNGKKTGRLQTWWPNGKLQAEYFFEDDEYQGTCREWNMDGSLVREMNYEKGHEQGSQKLFYDNGKIRANYTIIDGRRYGLLGTKNCVNVSDSIFNN